MSLDAIVRYYIKKKRPGANAELDWFVQQPTLAQTIEFASLAINRQGKRYSHQRRIKKDALLQARSILLSNETLIQQCQSFAELIAILDAILEPVFGLGELYIYDTALRIGAWLGLSPQKVYLHAGTRAGAMALGFSRREVALDIGAFPPEFQELKPSEIEDVLCIYKKILPKEKRRYDLPP